MIHIGFTILLFTLPIYFVSFLYFLSYFDLIGFIFVYCFTIIYTFSIYYYTKYTKIFIKEIFLRDNIKREIENYLEKTKIKNIDHNKYRKIEKYFDYLYKDLINIYVDIPIIKEFIDEDNKINSKIKDFIYDYSKNNKESFEFRIEEDKINIYIDKILVLERELNFSDSIDLSFASFYISNTDEGNILNQRLYNL